jgi:D-alanyl-D-alanine carboxypeptidase
MFFRCSRVNSAYKNAARRRCFYLRFRLNISVSLLFILALLFFSCINKNTVEKPDNREAGTYQETNFKSLMSDAVSIADLPDHISAKLHKTITENPAFMIDLFAVLQTDPYLWILVDKEHSLPSGYEPEDLVELKSGSYRVNRASLMLRRAAAASLEEMASAAADKKLTLAASSTYRSYQYQSQVYNRTVSQIGQKAADRESARPGHSQHQLGLVVDFGSIDDSFALTAESRWLANNASHFGWSLSFPDGFEEITGYRWESWHYRYVGKELAEFINNYFDGIQQYALKFIHAYKSKN